MLTTKERDAARERAAWLLREAGIALTPSETAEIEVADFGLSQLDQTGLQVVSYVNTDRVCAKELVLFPCSSAPSTAIRRSTAAQARRRPSAAAKAGSTSTPTGSRRVSPAARTPPDGVFTVWHETVLDPGDQLTVLPNTLHWFQAGEEGAIVSEFSTHSTDERDIFTDPRIQRERGSRADRLTDPLRPRRARRFRRGTSAPVRPGRTHRQRRQRRCARARPIAERARGRAAAGRLLAVGVPWRGCGSGALAGRCPRWRSPACADRQRAAGAG